MSLTERSRYSSAYKDGLDSDFRFRSALTTGARCGCAFEVSPAPSRLLKEALRLVLAFAISGCALGALILAVAR
jgi:hypothetical protein